MGRVTATAALLLGLVACAQGDSGPTDAEKTDAAIDQEVAAALMRAGEAARKRGDNAAAAAFYRRAQNAAPDTVGPLIGMGEALAAGGVTRESAQAFRRALVIDPD
ncbi:MAG: tetratricopeptide repeat protein, partial [Pseudomonadota bacterium]